jgi:hypothetical protein
MLSMSPLSLLLTWIQTVSAASATKAIVIGSVSITPTILTMVLVILVFLIILITALSCVWNVTGPKIYTEKPLKQGKEY